MNMEEEISGGFFFEEILLSQSMQEYSEEAYPKEIDVGEDDVRVLVMNQTSFVSTAIYASPRAKFIQHLWENLYQMANVQKFI